MRTRVGNEFRFLDISFFLLIQSKRKANMKKRRKKKEPKETASRLITGKENEVWSFEPERHPVFVKLTVFLG